MQPHPPEFNRLDHGLYAHRRAAQGPSRPWPGARPVAAFMLVRLQALELEPPAQARRDPRWRGGFGDFAPDYRGHSLMEYGSRIGIFRLLDLLQPLGWQVAVSVNGLVAREKPALVRTLQARGVELLASGWSASRMIDQEVPAELERAWLAQSHDALQQACGQEIRGYASQDYGYSTRSPALLAARGIDTAVDWPNDEWPMLFGAAGQLLMLPAAAEMEDAQMLTVRRLQSPVWARHLLAGLDYWAAQPAPGRVLALPLHAWISGAPHRFTNLEKVLTGFDARTFWQAGPAQIARAWRQAA